MKAVVGDAEAPRPGAWIGRHLAVHVGEVVGVLVKQAIGGIEVAEQAVVFLVAQGQAVAGELGQHQGGLVEGVRLPAYGVRQQGHQEFALDGVGEQPLSALFRPQHEGHLLAVVAQLDLLQAVQLAQDGGIAVQGLGARVHHLAVSSLLLLVQVQRDSGAEVVAIKEQPGGEGQAGHKQGSKHFYFKRHIGFLANFRQVQRGRSRPPERNRFFHSVSFLGSTISVSI